MDYNYLTIFNLKNDFTKKELNEAFLNNIKNIDSLNLNDDDKQILLDGYIKEYELAKFSLKNFNINNIDSINNNFDIFNNLKFNFNNFNNILNEFNNNISQNNVFTQSYSMNKVLNNNGTSTVIEKKNINNNGKIDNNISSFIIDKDGNKIPIDYNKALENINIYPIKN